MTAKFPTRVSIYMLQSGTSRVRGAEFRWSPEAGVVLVVHDEDHGGDLARWYYEHGVPDDAEQRAVPRSEPETFMRALLQLNRFSYFRIVDESDQNEPGAPANANDEH